MCDNAVSVAWRRRCYCCRAGTGVAAVAAASASAAVQSIASRTPWGRSSDHNLASIVLVTQLCLYKVSTTSAETERDSHTIANRTALSPAGRDRRDDPAHARARRAPDCAAAPTCALPIIADSPSPTQKTTKRPATMLGQRSQPSVVRMHVHAYRWKAEKLPSSFLSSSSPLELT